MQDVVDKNYQAVDRGNEYKTLAVDPAWAKLPDDEPIKRDEPEFITNIVRPINAQNGDLLPVSAYKGIEDGTWLQGTAASRFSLLSRAAHHRALSIHQRQPSPHRGNFCSDISWVCS